ncbi:MAG: DNA replication/repair protein RecF [Alphaproteobacteria bacterium]
MFRPGTLAIPQPVRVEAATAGRCAVRRLRLTDFRCYAQLSLDLDARPVVLTGENGAGKTNLLEAVSFLVPGRGLRGARLTEVARRATGDAIDAGIRPWAVAASVDAGDGPFDIGTGLAPDSAPPGRRVVRLDGETRRGQAALGERLSALWLTPDMERLFADGAGGRRRFLDRLVFAFDPAHSGRLKGYENAMRDRARLLKRAESEGRRPDAAWLSALEATMVERGVAVAAARAELINRLNPACALGVGPFPTAELSIEGEIDGWLATMPAVEAEDRYRARLAETRSRDAESGTTACGPHRGDLHVLHLGKNVPAALCSTGEQKALLIAIVLANARLQTLEAGRVPLLLLDEVAAHLDKARRSALFDEIAALGAQAWLTGTDAATFAPLGREAQFFTVAEATLYPTDQSRLTA